VFMILNTNEQQFVVCKMSQNSTCALQTNNCILN